MKSGIKEIAALLLSSSGNKSQAKTAGPAMPYQNQQHGASLPTPKMMVNGQITEQSAAGKKVT